MSAVGNYEVVDSTFDIGWDVVDDDYRVVDVPAPTGKRILSASFGMRTDGRYGAGDSFPVNGGTEWRFRVGRENNSNIKQTVHLVCAEMGC